MLLCQAEPRLWLRQGTWNSLRFRENVMPTEWDWNKAKGLGRFAREAPKKGGWEQRTPFLAVPGEGGKAWQEGKKIAKFGEVESDHSFVLL